MRYLGLSLFASIGFLAAPGLAPLSLAAEVSDKVISVDARLGHSVLHRDRRQKVYLRIGLKGLRSDDEQERTPANIALVIDRSGSMRGRKMRRAREAAILAVERLNKQDVAAVVAFSTDVNVVAPARHVRRPQRLISRIDSLEAGGRTAIYAAVRAGARELEEYSSKRRIDRIILLSDGLANIGPREPEDFIRLGQRLGNKGVAVTTIGLGRGYNEDLMAGLANASDGNHAFARTANDLRRIFDEEFDDVLSIVAQRIEIIIRLAPGVRALDWLGRKAKLEDGGRKASFTVNQIYASSSHSLQLELEVDPARAGAGDIADVEVRYRNRKSEQARTVTASVDAKFSNDDDRVKRSYDPVVMDPVTVLKARAKAREAIKLRDSGRREDARAALQDAAKYISRQRQVKRSLKLAPSAQLKKLNQRYEADAQAVTKRNWNVQRKMMKQGLSNRTGSSTKY